MQWVADNLPYENKLMKPYLSVVVPAFNEEDRIDASLQRLVNYFRGETFAWEILVVDDGSSDSTAHLVGNWVASESRIRLLQVIHGGKGWAVKTGMLAAKGMYRFMCDADLAMPIEQLLKFHPRIDEGYDIVIGSRQIEGARRFNESRMRHFRGRVFNWVVRLIVVNGIEDTQCGFKYFTKEAAEKLFVLQRTHGLGFDVEILFLAQKSGLRVFELPIDWYHHSDGKVRPLVDSVHMLMESIKIRIWYLLGKYP